MKTVPTVIALALLMSSLAPPGFAAERSATTDVGTLDKETAAKVFPAKPPYSPYAGRNFPTRPFFGDTHLHTSFSMDAGAFGCRLGPSEAYRFAKGEEITASSGQRAKLSRPLDFLVVADHSDGLGFFPLILGGDPKVLADPQGRKWYDMIQSGKGADAAIDIIINFGKGTIPKAILPVPGTPAYRGAWDETIKAADEANDPGRFTAFIGYEWTSNTGGNNLHRNVIFRDNGDKASLVEPFITMKPYGSDNPRDLWKWMAAYEEKTGGEVLAHRPQRQFEQRPHVPDHRVVHRQDDRPRVRRDTRMRWEPLYEATQIKGDGETHPFLSPNDEFANFERWDKGNLDLSEPKKPEMLEFEYARSALKNGLKMEAELGVNPYKFGLVGSTDAHTALAAVEEDNFFGKTSSAEPSATRARIRSSRIRKTGSSIMGWEIDRVRLRRRVGDARTHARRSSTPCSAAKPTPRPARA